MFDSVAERPGSAKSEVVRSQFRSGVVSHSPVLGALAGSAHIAGARCGKKLALVGQHIRQSTVCLQLGLALGQFGIGRIFGSRDVLV